MSILIIVVQVVLGLLFVAIGSMALARKKSLSKLSGTLAIPMVSRCHRLAGSTRWAWFDHWHLGAVAGSSGKRRADAGHAGGHLDPRAHTRTFAEGCPATRDGGAGNSARRELLAHVPAPCWQTINDWSSE